MGLLASSGGFVIGSALSGVARQQPDRFVVHDSYPASCHGASRQLGFRFCFRCYFGSFGDLALCGGRRFRWPADLQLGLCVSQPWLARSLLGFPTQSLARGAYFFFIAHFIMDSFDVTTTNVSLFMSLMGVGPCISFAFAMPLLRRRYSPRAIASWSLLATAVLIVASAFAPTMMLEWCLILPISVTLAISYASLVILFTDLASQDTKGEIFGVTAAIKAFAFGMIAFAGGGMQTFDESVPLIASSLLMAVSWIIFQSQRPKPAIEEVGSRLRVAKA